MKKKLICMALIVESLLCSCGKEEIIIDNKEYENVISEEIAKIEYDDSESEVVSENKGELKEDKYINISAKTWEYTDDEKRLISDLEYDEKGNVLKKLSLNNDVWVYTYYNYVYDSAGNPEYVTVCEQSGSDGAMDEVGVISFINEYNVKTGNLSGREYIDINQIKIKEEFDNDGILISTCREFDEPNSSVTINADGIELGKDVFKYNERGNLIHFVRYNSAGGIIAESILEYDEQGELLHTISKNGEEIEECNYILDYEYDADGRKIKSVSTDDKGNKMISFYEYDSLGNYNVKQESYSDEKINYEHESKYIKIE